MSKLTLNRLSKLITSQQRNWQQSSPSLWNAPYSDFLRAIGKLFSPYWLACIPLTAIIVAVWHGAVAAQDVTVVESITVEGVSENVATLQGYLNMIWVLIAAILVIFMNAGFAMLETGLCRQKNAVNILAKNLIVFALATIAFWSIGFSLMFGQGAGFIGSGGWFLGSNDPATYSLKPFPKGLPIPVYFLFQVAFAGTAATIVSGAVAERVKFVDFIIFSLLLVGISYPITGHWVWSGSGWLAALGFKDFAGSTVVHAVGGWSALMGAAILGARTGKFTERRTNAIPGHNLSIATLGCLILWIGWFGFNPGSQLAVDEAVPYIAVTTNLAAAAGGIAATFTCWSKDGKPDLSMVINGILAGLVAVTAGCNVVSYWGAIVIGIVAGILVVYAVAFFDQIRIDDPVGAVSVHLVNGTWGTLAVGLLADPNIPIAPDEGAVTGLLFGNAGQILNQIIGIVAVGAFTVIFSGVAWILLKATLGIRVSLEEEVMGLDVGEHGMEAYSGFVKEGDFFASTMSQKVGGTDLPDSSEV